MKTINLQNTRSTLTGSNSGLQLGGLTVSGQATLARTLQVLKDQAHSEPFTMVSKWPRADQVALERRDIVKSLEYARANLGL